MDCERNMKKYELKELENRSYSNFENSCDDYFNEKHLLGHLKKVMHLEP